MGRCPTWWLPCRIYVAPAAQRQKVWLMPTTRAPCSKLHGTQVANSAPCIIPLGGNSPRKCIYSVPAQEKAKHCAKFGWPPLSDVAAVMKPRRKARWNVLGCPNLTNRSQLLADWSSPYCEDMCVSYCCLTSFFLIVGTCLSCDGAQMANFWKFFLRPVFSVSRIRHASDLHPKLSLRPHHV